jgi:hypothetical protein
MSVVCGGSDGGSDDATPTPDAMPVMEADMGQPDATTPDMNPAPTPEMMAECGNGECEEGEDEVNCPADCTPAQPVCEEVGAVCDPENTGAGNNMVCLFGDSTDETSATCHQLCDASLESADCPSGAFCGELQSGDAACIRSNCTSTFNSVEECAGVGENGGTCFETENDGHFCFAAGAAVLGGACAETSDCGPQLFCLDSVCQDFCENGNDESCGDLSCLPVLSSDVVGVCGSGCTPFSPDTLLEECGDSASCFPLDADSGLCQAAGTAELGDPCEAPDDCNAEGLCQRLSAGDPSTCHAVCDRREGFGDETCPDGEICLEINDAAGVCFEGCTPLVPEDENGCTQEGLKTCIPIDDPARGLCLESGDKTEGETCEFIDDSIFGDCQGDLACVSRTQDGETGECAPICATFSSVNDYESGCDDGEVCEIFGLAFGVCGTDVANPPLNAFEPCPTAGQWCSNDVLCLQADQQGNNACIPICRLGEQGDLDCPASPNGPTTCQELLASDSLGLCVP